MNDKSVYSHHLIAVRYIDIVRRSYMFITSVMMENKKMPYVISLVLWAT